MILIKMWFVCHYKTIILGKFGILTFGIQNSNFWVYIFAKWISARYSTENALFNDI